MTFLCCIVVVVFVRFDLISCWDRYYTMTTIHLVNGFFFRLTHLMREIDCLTLCLSTVFIFAHRKFRALVHLLCFVFIIVVFERMYRPIVSSKLKITITICLMVLEKLCDARSLRFRYISICWSWHFYHIVFVFGPFWIDYYLFIIKWALNDNMLRLLAHLFCLSLSLPLLL